MTPASPAPPPAAPPAGACCDLHGRNCEPPSELCCEYCTEARHAGWTDGRGTWRYGHPRGEECVLSGRPQEAATPAGVPSLESLAHALFDAFYSQFDIAPPGWEPLSTIGNGWLAVAQVASDGASIAAKAVTDALAAENERLRALAAEILGEIVGHCDDPNCPGRRLLVSEGDVAEWRARAGLEAPDGA